MSAERTSPWRCGRASHYSLTVSSSCWLAGMPEDTRQPDIGTGRYAHTDIHFGRCRLQDGLPVFSSVLLFINLSNTIKDCQQEWQKEKESEEKEERERERLPPSLQRYDCLHAAASKIKLLICLITLCLALCCSWNVLQHFAHADASHTQMYLWENVVIKAWVLWAANILHCQLCVWYISRSVHLHVLKKKRYLMPEY